MNTQAPGQTIRFRLAIPADKYLAYYEGRAQNVVVRAEDGRSLRFPASNLRPFLQHEGIFGLFEIRLDCHNKLIDIVCLGNG